WSSISTGGWRFFTGLRKSRSARGSAQARPQRGFRRPPDMRIAIVTDAWAPQINGVVRTLTATVGELMRRGHTVAVIAPDQFRTVPCPTYPEIRLALAGSGAVGRRIESVAADAIHIAT